MKQAQGTLADATKCICSWSGARRESIYGMSVYIKTHSAKDIKFGIKVPVFPK